MMQRFSQYPWYIFLFAVYSPIALIAYNTGQVAYSAALRSLLIILAAVFIFTLLVLLMVRNVHKAGLIVTLALVLFFSYGHVYELVAKMNLGGLLIGRHRYLSILYLLILAGTSFWVIKTRSPSTQWPSALMTIAIVSLIFPVYRLAAYEIRSQSQDRGVAAASPGEIRTSSREELPDIYYIILDTYGRTDMLKKYAGYDNSGFIESLENLGFYVAKCSLSNYSQTGLSLASSLNFSYLEELGLNFSNGGSKREDVEAPYIKHNAVVDRLRDMGYQIVAFETGYEFTTLDDTDTLYPAPKSGISDFELALLRSTALVLLDDAGMFKEIYPTAAQNRRDMVLYQLKTLKDLPSLPGPKFVFAHLLIPHWPFVFGPNGESLIGPNLTQSEGVGDKAYFDAYRGQAIFTSSQILEVASEIIRKSDPAPIIIIQGDHGPSHAGRVARLAILNAYYFPGGQTAGLYPEITPVNSFPLIFNTFFGSDFELHPDVSYFSRYDSPDKREMIPNECNSQ